MRSKTRSHTTATENAVSRTTPTSTTRGRTAVDTPYGTTCSCYNVRSMLDDTDSLEHDAIETNEGPAFRCAACETEIADAGAVFAAADGKTRHVFANPHGVVFEVLTFAAARNLVGAGPREAEFSWFPGWTWRIVICGGCHTHLGWMYEAAQPGCTPLLFWGLLEMRLILD